MNTVSSKLPSLQHCGPARPDDDDDDDDDGGREMVMMMMDKILHG